MSIIKSKAYLPSAEEQSLLYAKYPAFSCAYVSEKAKKQGAYSNSENKGHYYLRTILPWESSTPVDFVATDGSHALDIYTDKIPGLRISMSLNYDANSQIVKNCKTVKRTTYVYNDTAGEEITKSEKKVTSKAPVVTFGGIDYIWLNKKECEKGNSAVMQIISVDLLEKAEPFTLKKHNADYAKAEELRAQCERVALENATEEEKAMVLDAIMSSNDKYKNVVYTNSEIANDIVDNLFNQLSKGELTVEEWENKMLAQLEEMSNDDSFSNEELVKFGDYISSAYEVLKDKEKMEADYAEL